MVVCVSQPNLKKTINHAGVILDSCLKLSKMKEITIKQQLKQADNVMEMAVLRFKEQLQFQLSIDKDFYDKPTEGLLNVSDCKELYVIVMEDDYWVKVWSDLLFLILVDVVHE